MAEVVIDARGQVCPLPIIALAKAAATAAAGDELTVECTDVAARIDVPAWARMTGNEFLGETRIEQTQTDGGAFALTVRLR